MKPPSLILEHWIYANASQRACTWKHKNEVLPSWAWCYALTLGGPPNHVSLRWSATHGTITTKTSQYAELLIIETHPIQYHAPVYRHLEQALGISVTVVYGSDFSITGYHDAEFGSKFAWDTDLISGYDAVFLSRASEGGARNDREGRYTRIGKHIRKTSAQGRPVRRIQPAFSLGGFSLRATHG